MQVPVPTPSIGFEPEGDFERVGRHHLEVVRVVEPRRSVQRAAVLVDDLDVLELGHMLGALKHHVLEEVREAGPVLGLDAESDPVHHLDHDDRRRGVLADDDAQAVRQLLVDDRNRERLCGHRRRGRPEESEAQHES
jgi:hypothetical protein